MNTSARPLSRVFRGESPTLEGHELFFDSLMEIVRGQPIDDNLGQRIREHVLRYLETNPAMADNYDPDSYVRNIIGRCPLTGWEAILMTWQKGNRTAIHAHPAFASYTIADGEFLIEIFEPGSNGARLKDLLLVYKRQCFYAVGSADGYDNHIHRITCLSDTGHSLHVYSDNALKGYKYDLATE